MAEDIGSTYFESRRRSEGAKALSEFLARDGLDENLNPLQPKGPEAGQAPAAAPMNMIDARQASLDRMRKLQQEIKNPPEQQPSFFRDVVGGTLTETGKAIYGGAMDSVKEMLSSADSLAGYLNEKMGTPKGGMFKNLAEMVPEVSQSKGTGAELLRSFSQFLTAFAPASKISSLIGVSGKIAKPMLAGLIADIAAFNPNDPNLSTAFNNLAPALRNPMTDFLATNPNDSEALNRFRRGIEGLGLGVATEAVIGVARTIRARIGLHKAEQAFNAARAETSATSPQAAGTAGEALTPEVMPPTGGAGRAENVRPLTGQDVPLGEQGTGGVMQGQRLALPEPIKPETIPTMQPEDAGRMVAMGDEQYAAARVQSIADRLARSADDPTVQTIGREMVKAEQHFVDEQGRIIARDVPLGAEGQGGVLRTFQTADEIAAAIEKEITAAENLRQSPRGGDLLRQELSRAEIASQVKESPIIRAGVEQQLHTTGDQVAMELVRKESPTLTALKDALEKLQKPAAERTTTAKRLSGSDIGAMLADIKTNRDVPSLFAITLDDSLPRDVRRNAADVLNTEMRREAMAGVGDLTPEQISKASRSGLLESGIKAVAKAKAGQRGEISQAAMFTLARAGVGAAIGLSQGDTMEERLTKAAAFAGIGAALSPALIKRFVGSLEKVAPDMVKAVRSFEPQAGAAPGAAGKFTRVQQKAATATIEFATEKNAKEFLAANPGRTIDIGTTPLKINWENIGDGPAIEDVINKVASTITPEIDAARRGVIGKELSDEMARRFGIRDDVFLGLKPGDILNIEKTKALIATTGDAFKYLDELHGRLVAGENVGNQFRAQLGKASALLTRMSGVRAEQGRVLPVWGQAAELMDRAARFNTDFGLMTVGGKSIDQVPIDKLAQMYGALNGELQRSSFLKNAVQLGKSAVLEAWINGLLTNPVTHASNIISNAMTTGMAIAERQVAGMLGKEVATGEAATMVHALASGWQDALTLAKRAFQTGESQFAGMGGKVDTRHTRAITGENFGLTGDIGRAVDMLGAGVNTPTRALMAADDFFKAINYRMEMHAQAFRQATKEGGTSDVISKRMSELLDAPAFQSLVKDQATDFAAYQTFNQQLGIFGNGFIKMLDEHPLGRVLFPFVRTPVNIAKYTLEHTPLIGLQTKRVAEDLAAGGARAELARAKQMIGGLTMLSAGYMAYNGLITGGGPLDPDLKALKMASGWQPYSVKVGDQYVSYKRLDPVGFMIGLAADMVEKGGELDDATIGNLAMAATVGFKDTFVDKTYLQGVSDFWDAMRQPDKKLETYLRKTAGSIVPAGVAQLTRIMDPTLKEINSASDAIFSRLPGYGGPARRNIWGDKIQLEGAVGPDIVSPFYSSTDKKDPATDEIIRLGMSLDMPEKHVYGLKPSNNVLKNYDPRWGVRLTPEEYSRYAELAGNDLKIEGKGLHDKVNDYVQSSEYKQQNDYVHRVMIQSLFTAYRRAAQGQLLKEFPDLRDAVEQRMMDRAESATAPAEPIP